MSNTTSVAFFLSWLLASPWPALAASTSAAVSPGPRLVEACVRVKVDGAVRHPSCYLLPLGARRFDAVQRAGGLAPGGDPAELDLGRELVDGETVHVRHIGDPTPAPATVATAAPDRHKGSSRSGGKSPAPGTHVSLAHASVEQLERLPGVGPRLADDIVAYRRSHGGFRSVDELREIRGIGERRMTRLRPWVTP